MSLRPLFPLLLLLVLPPPAHAADPCLDCLKAAKEEWRACLQQAISVEDQLACEDRQEERAKRCDREICRIEREDSDKAQTAPAPDR